MQALFDKKMKKFIREKMGAKEGDCMAEFRGKMEHTGIFFTAVSVAKRQYISYNKENILAAVDDAAES